MNVSGKLGEYRHLLDLMKIESEPMEQDFTGKALKDLLKRNPNSINLGTLFIDAIRKTIFSGETKTARYFQCFFRRRN